MSKFVVYWTEESYENDGQVITDQSQRGFFDANSESVTEFVNALPEGSIIYHDGVTYHDNVPEKFKQFEVLQDGTLSDKMLYEIFVDAMIWQWGSKA